MIVLLLFFHAFPSARSGCVVLFVRPNCSIATGLVLTVWADRTSANGKTTRKLCTGACPVSDCYAFRVVELAVVSEDGWGFKKTTYIDVLL